MLVISVDNKEVTIPQSYSELKLNEWTKIWKILCSNNIKSDVTTEEGVEELVVNEIKLTKEIVAQLLGLTPKDVDRLDYTQCEEVIGVFNHMLNTDLFDTKDGWGDTEFTHKGETYHFPKNNFEDMSFGEYASLKQYETQLENDELKRFDIIPEQMAYCCRKKGEKKESYDLDKRAKLFQDVPMDIVMKLTFFLHKRINSLQAVTQIYLDKETKIAQQKELDISSKDMGGLIQYIE